MDLPTYFIKIYPMRLSLMQSHTFLHSKPKIKQLLFDSVYPEFPSACLCYWLSFKDLCVWSFIFLEIALRFLFYFAFNEHEIAFNFSFIVLFLLKNFYDFIQQLHCFICLISLQIILGHQKLDDSSILSFASTILCR